MKETHTLGVGPMLTKAVIIMPMEMQTMVVWMELVVLIDPDGLIYRIEETRRLQVAVAATLPLLKQGSIVLELRRPLAMRI